MQEKKVMQKMLKKRLSGVVAAGACFLVTCTMLFGCGAAQKQEASEQKASTGGKTLEIYCGAGMKNPFQEIVDAFMAKTGHKAKVTFANAAQIQSQINTSEQGDLFVAGAADELQPVKKYVAKSTDLVKHIPVLVVPEKNPKKVTSIADLSHCDTVLVGDPKATPIGKIAKKVMTEANIWDSMMSAGKLTTTTTAPQIAAALANGEGDAGIVWKENIKSEHVTTVKCDAMTKAIKTIPAAELTCSQAKEEARAFNEFLQSDAAWKIWEKYGYERAA